jgi:hypothetical protein
MEWPILGMLFLTALMVEPFVLLATAAVCARLASKRTDTVCDSTDGHARHILRRVG